MAGFLTYFSVFALTIIWILGWGGVSYVAGAFFDLPMKTTVLVGALLGPLGFVVTLATGILERNTRKGTDRTGSVSSSGNTNEGSGEWDLFA